MNQWKTDGKGRGQVWDRTIEKACIRSRELAAVESGGWVGGTTELWEGILHSLELTVLLLSVCTRVYL